MEILRQRPLPRGKVLRPLAYLTDVEGRWEKLVEFARHNPSVRLEADSLQVTPGAVFVFGGDAIDRGPHGKRVVRTLTEARQSQPDRVVLLAGNRDINKLRLARELRGHPPAKAIAQAPEATGTTLLRFIFSQTMGAANAFENRRAELVAGGLRGTDDEVTESYLADLEPEGELTRYLSSLRLAHREGETLLVHGGITEENFGLTPGVEGRTEDVDEWVSRLNAFYQRSIEAFRADPADDRGYAELVRYQAPLPGTRLNQTSVVYARPTNERGDPLLIPRALIERLARAGVRRVVLGHTPSGDSPAWVRDREGFELVLADNSYGRIEGGSRVFIGDQGLRFEGKSRLDDGEEVQISTDSKTEAAGPLGLRLARTGQLLKGRLTDGRYLAFRAPEERKVEQVALTGEDIAGERLILARD